MCIDCILFGFLERWCCFQCVLSSHLSSHLKWTNQEACNMSDDTAAVELAQAHVNCVDYTEVVFFPEFHQP